MVAKLLNILILCLKAAGWFFGLSFMLGGVMSLSDGNILLSASIALLGMLAIPPIFIRLRNKQISTQQIVITALATLALFYTADILIAEPMRVTEKQDQAIETARLAEEKLQQKKDAFFHIRDEVITELNGYVEEKNFSQIAHVAGKYLDVEDPEIQKLYDQAQSSLQAEQERIAEAQKAEAIRKKSSDYIQFIETQIADMDNYDVGQFLGDKDSIVIASAVYSAMAMHLDEAKKYDLTAEQKNVVGKFRRILKDRQVNDLPRLRDAYGPAARKALWIKDITAKTLGTGYRTIEFAGGLFAANANKATFHVGIVELLKQLRFKQANYMWYEGADKYTFFEIDSPKDTDIVIFEQSGWRIVE